MKRNLIIALSGLIIITLFGIYIENYLKKSAEVITKIIDEIEKTVIIVEIDSAKEKLNELNEEWERTKDKWSMLIDHEEMDNVEETIQYIEIFIDETDRQADLLAEINKLRFYIEHIPEKESFLVKNIF